ncbi:circadian clock KaiB family protein [Desulfosoma caldarium]|uniref:Circadian clock protein KaiB n=1 Tax=Desulfosoma caldarium TaxID=610254 RepID=A0A3N1UK17_9BACT|nr:circadian clock KaiB family protein [Desulfosoma caldarium]ROQ90118.1 circadian clock protein KaiB [Desulfosoma caldarium]
MTRHAQDVQDIQTHNHKPRYRLRLFVAGDEPNSVKAKAMLARLCDTVLRHNCQVIVVDVLQDYQAAIEYHVIVVPTLMVEWPPPVRSILGSLTDEDKVVAALGLLKDGGAP